MERFCHVCCHESLSPAAGSDGTFRASVCSVGVRAGVFLTEQAESDRARRPRTTRGREDGRMKVSLLCRHEDRRATSDIKVGGRECVKMDMAIRKGKRCGKIAGGIGKARNMKKTKRRKRECWRCLPFPEEGGTFLRRIVALGHLCYKKNIPHFQPLILYESTPHSRYHVSVPFRRAFSFF